MMWLALLAPVKDTKSVRHQCSHRSAVLLIAAVRYTSSYVQTAADDALW